MANELILLVEDNEKNRRLMRDVLAFKGYRLAEAETGEEGVRLAGELHPDLILMDIQLPGINGIAAFRKIRENPATEMIPVIAVTASAMTQDRQKIMAAGFEGYQSKPLNVRAFVQAIEGDASKRVVSCWIGSLGSRLVVRLRKALTPREFFEETLI